MSAPHASPHLVIAASAGSGKTWQLVNRYIHLLATGASPVSLAALTFSRKAAGEILWKILQRLATASQPDASGALDDLNRALAAGGLDRNLSRAEVRGLLRRLLSDLNLARVGTIDSFFAAVLGCFPLELGFAGEAAVVDGGLLAPAVDQAMRRVLLAPGAESQRRVMVEALKQATFGKEARRLSEVFTELVQDLQQLYLEAPDPGLWGGPEAIWGPDGCPWPASPLPPKLNYARAAVADCSDAAKKGFLKLFEALETYVPGAPASRDGLKNLAPKLLALCASFGKHGVTLLPEFTINYYRRDTVFEGQAAAELSGALMYALRGELDLASKRTLGRHALMAAFEEVYDREIRRRGAVSFADMLFVLTRGAHQGLFDTQGRQDLEYRLDARFDHWLLDEFQDTSSAQWRVLGNLLSEVLQDDSGRRSVFYVGDVKQAIYGWRGGNNTLFQQILDYYDPEGGRIRRLQLATSYRSTPQVMEAVNAVFGALGKVQNLHPDAIEDWNRVFAPHQANRKDPGFVGYLQTTSDEDDAVPAACARLLTTLQPLQRGLSVAVLTRTNKAGQQLAESLSAAGIPAVFGGGRGMADNVPVLACLAFLRLVLHSTDAFAKGYLALGPLADLANTLGDPGGRDRLLGVLTLEGYEAFFGRLVPVFTALPALAPSEKAALQNLLEAARNFDLEGRGSAQAFEDYVFGWSSPQVESPDFVQVMTIHRAKGLEWDLVLLPELDSRGAGGSETLVAREGGLGDGVAWILEPPPAFVLEADPVLSERKDQARRREHYEAACLFYVAMTRAATALYLVGPEPSAKSEALNQATILRDTVGPFTGQTWTPGGAADSFNFLACWGSPDWYKNRVARTPPAPPAPVAQAAEAVPGAPRTRRLPVARPGRDLGGSVSAEKVFKGSAEARDTGNLVHELFSSLEFLEEGAAPQAVQAFRAARGATLPPDALEEAIQTFSAALVLPQVQQLLTRRDPHEVVWRERAFEMVLEGRWYSGVFDRVTVVGEGADAKVLLLDYKTGHSPKGQPPEQYRQQLMAYRQALKALLGLANLAQVDTRLLYTREGAVFSLDVEGKWS